MKCFYGGAVIAAITLSQAAAAPEPASDIPVYDVDKYCKKEADIYGKDPTMLKVCLEDEQKAYDKLKKRWSTLNNIIKTDCLPVPNELGSYYKLAVCILRDLKEDEELEDFKFRR
jgi:hypothetical protein